MKVELVKWDGLKGEFYAVDWLQVGTKEADFVEGYVNKITNKPDPQIFYTPKRWVHMSTALHHGFKVRSVETGEMVTVNNLSPN